MRRVWAILVALFSLFVIINPGAGVLDLIPDNMPWIGNLDEATAALLLVWALKRIFLKKVPPKEREKTVH